MKARYWVWPLLLGLTACGSDNDSPLTGAGTDFEGIWSAPAYGLVLDIQDDRMRTYHVTSNYCLIGETQEGLSQQTLQKVFQLSEDLHTLTDPGFNGTKEFHAPVTRYSRIDRLPDACLTPLAQKSEPGYQRNPVRDFELFAETFEELYVDFERKGVDWSDIRAQGLAQLQSDSSDEELLDILYRSIQPLKDAHVQIEAGSLGTASVNGKPVLVESLIQEYAEDQGLSLPLPLKHAQPLNVYISTQLQQVESIIDQYAPAPEAIKTTANGRLKWFQTDGVAYLNISAMQGFADDVEDPAAEIAAAEQAIDRVIEDIQDSSGLILDIRLNNGGYDFLSMILASRFADQPRTLFSKQARLGDSRTPLQEVEVRPLGARQFTGPIILLTSSSTVSAAETFTLMMKELPHVILMGEATQGAFSDKLSKPLPNGFIFSLSNEFYYDTAGQTFEGVGIPADIPVPVFTRQQRLEETDLAIETAYLFLTE